MPRKLYVGKSNRIKLESSRGVTTTATQRVYRLRKVHDIKEIGIKNNERVIRFWVLVHRGATTTPPM